VGHQRGGAAQEAVRGGHHPAHPDGDQPRDPAAVRGDDQLDRIRPVVGRLPLAEALAGHGLAQRAADRVALLP
jgi:hypothetical protein